MWLSLLFGGTAALFLAMTVAALFHLRWVKRLPSLAALSAESNAGSGHQGPVEVGQVQPDGVVAAIQAGRITHRGWRSA